ncbi:MAG: TIM barrel protein, partial [Candidatus Azobacteroides sp.]|nr:TIM barrel protein [Candidatus Azobacteroides sp.]
GMKYIITPWMPTPETLDDLQAYCDYYNKIGEKCAAAGLKFGYHNHAYEFEKKYPDGTVMYDYMVSHTDPSKVFFEMDVYWTMMGHRSPVELFKKYPGRFLVLHIKDDKELGESGMVGFDAIFKNLATAGTKYLIVEVERYNLPPFESVKASLDYLNNADFVKADYSK